MISCNVNIPSNNFQICCYGFKAKNEMIITRLYTKLPTTNELIDYTNTVVYNAQYQINQSYKNPFFCSNPLKINSLLKSAKVITIANSNVNQINGIGIAKITILLPREPIRKMKL